MDKKELKISRRVLKIIITSLLLSIVTIFVIQNFGKITGGFSENWGHYKYIENGKQGLRYEFVNPISQEQYYQDYIIGEQIGKDGKLSYQMKLFDFYIPSLFGNIMHIVFVFIVYASLLWFLKRYKLKFV